MPLRIDQTLRGRKASYKLLESLKGASVFKARVVVSNQNAQPDASATKLAVIKAEPLEDRRKVIYKREYESLQHPKIAASPFIRALEDSINHDGDDADHRAMVLEWMDMDLWKARMHSRSQDPKLQKLVARSILEALAVFADIQGTHTDINPTNVLISGIETSTPVIKLADLGNLCGEGIDWVRLQGLAIRAPEVWSGLGCWPASDVWSLGVTVYLTRPGFAAVADNFQMVHWLAKRPIFGASDKVVEGLTESWCIAKVKRLVGPLSLPVKPEYIDEFEAAHVLESEMFQTPEMTEPRRFITTGTLRQELEKLPSQSISEECIDFIQSLLVIDHTARPSAREALDHPFITRMR